MESFLDIAILLVHARNVDFGVEFDGWGNHWIVISTGDRHHVDPVVEVRVWWTNDGSIPVCERFIITYNLIIG